MGALRVMLRDLVGVNGHWREPQSPRAAWIPPADWETTEALVRPYVVCHLGEADRTARRGERVNPWEARK